MDKTYANYLKAVVALLILFNIIVFSFGKIALNKLERIVQIAEGMNEKVDRAYTAAAPVGKAVVEKGVKTIEGMNSQELSDNATHSVKELETAAKDKALGWLNKKAATTQTSSKPD